ncbi:MAG: hypothetical protein RQ758_00415 [Methanomicrobiaceae archaeon]|nr:hypothetical protein [Methanomicrobiaceae archaeon]
MILVIASVGFLAGLGIGISEGMDSGGIMLSGFVPAASVFLAWALGREIYPEEEISALIAATFFLIAFPLLPRPDVITLLWVLLVLRILNRTAGSPANLADLSLVFLLTLWPLWQGNAVAGLITAGALIVDGLLGDPGSRRFSIAMAIIIVTVIMAFLTEKILIFTPPFSLSVTALGAASLLFLPVIMSSTRARGDSGKTLSTVRVRAGQLAALATALTLALTDIYMILPLWFAIAAAGGSHLWHFVARGL